MVLHGGQHFAELHEEAFTWGVAVGVHVEGGLLLGSQRHEQPLVGLGEQGGGGDGYRLVACGEHRPTVACALGDEERFAGAEHGEYGEVVDGATRAVGKTETGGAEQPLT